MRLYKLTSKNCKKGNAFVERYASINTSLSCNPFHATTMQRFYSSGITMFLGSLQKQDPRLRKCNNNRSRKEL